MRPRTLPAILAALALAALLLPMSRAEAVILNQNVTYEATFSLTDAANFDATTNPYVRIGIRPTYPSNPQPPTTALVELFNSSGTFLGSSGISFGSSFGTRYIATPSGVTDSSGRFRITLFDGPIDFSTLGVQYNVTVGDPVGAAYTSTVNVLPSLQPVSSIPLPATLPMLLAALGAALGLSRLRRTPASVPA